MTTNLVQSLSSDTMLKIIQKSTYDAFFITDENEKIIFVSDSYQRFTNIDPKTILNQHISILKQNDLLKSNVVERVYATHKPISKVLKYENQKEMLVTAIPVFDEQGNYIACVGNIRDMDELNSLNNKLTLSRKTDILSSGNKSINLEFLNNTYIYQSTKMQSLVEFAFKLAKFHTNVLITGESGVGKDIYARLINDLSNHFNKANKPFVKISCGAIPESLLESELFGYEVGSFTGANKDGKIGLLETAKDGVIFLDEIGELPLTLQAKLLNVLQDRKFYRIGGLKPIPLNARIIAATNKNLERALQEGLFREDLYYRLNVINIELPALKDRRDDIIPLVDHFLHELNEKYNLNYSIDSKVLDIFLRYSWPGNIRELSNIIERLFVLTSSDIINEKELPENFLMNNGNNQFSKGNLPLKTFLESMEKERVLKALADNKTLKEAAKELEVDLSTLTRKVQKLNIPNKNKTGYVHSELLKSF